jgi:hypothetical protein
MKLKHTRAILLVATLIGFTLISYAFYFLHTKPSPTVVNEHIRCTPERHVCVMKTLFGLEDNSDLLKSITDVELPAEVNASVATSLTWMANAQLPDGGWGAGSHTRQDIRDPHQVQADPATTSVVSLALLRTGSTLTSGAYQQQLTKATGYLLKAVESWHADQPYLTTLTETQPQRKLGQNIDAILTVQYFTNLLKYHDEHAWKQRIEKALQKCVTRIEKEQDTDGGWKGGGWAPVLQSALADHALESAKDVGITVDSAVISKSKNYQKGNYDTATNSAITGKAAGVLLYSLSSTTRSSAKEAKKAKLMVEKGKMDGRVSKDEQLNEESLVKSGASPAEAKQMVTAMMINENTKKQSSSEDVMQGFGSNGGEELISYLMTGESIMLQGDVNEWKKWYTSMSKKIVSIQKPDGSWEGHHCITSPVFCTAAALLILSVQNDLSLATTSK